MSISSFFNLPPVERLGLSSSLFPVPTLPGVTSFFFKRTPTPIFWGICSPQFWELEFCGSRRPTLVAIAVDAFRTGQNGQGDPRGHLGRRYLEESRPLTEMGGADQNLVTGPEGLVLLATAGLPESALPFHLLSGLIPALSGRA